MKPRPPVSADGITLPADLAAGPDPAVWAKDGRDRQSAARRAWRETGAAWSRLQLGSENGWRELLPEDVRYATSSLGRAHARSGGYVPPWDRP